MPSRPTLPWPRAWRSPEPKRSYDVVLIGGGGHGLATAYYLASNHGITNVAVPERAYVGSGNVGRNTMLVRSTYVIDGNAQFFEHSMKLWEGERGQHVAEPGSYRRGRSLGPLAHCRRNRFPWIGTHSDKPLSQEVCASYSGSTSAYPITSPRASATIGKGWPPS
jgi:hypothetical protein